jgi:hypothetical protein
MALMLLTLDPVVWYGVYTLRRFLAAFLIGLALLTGFRAAIGDGLPPAGWLLLAALLLVLGIGTLTIWNRRRRKVSCCYTSCDYYCPQ